MILIANILLALAKIMELANGLLTIYKYILLASVIISWVNADPYNPVVRFLHQVTDPVLNRIRRFLPAMGGFDLSPMVLIFAIIFLQSFLVPTLRQLAAGLQ